MKPKSVSLILIVFFSVLGGGVYALPYWTISKIQQAVEKSDAEALGQYMNFERIRPDLKEQLQAYVTAQLGDQMNNPTFAAIGLNLTNKISDKLLDTFFSPSGLITVMRGEAMLKDLKSKKEKENTDPQQATSKNTLPTENKDNQEMASKAEQEKRLSLSDAELGFVNLSKFAVKIRQSNSIQPLVLFLEREGLTWTVVQIKLPI